MEHFFPFFLTLAFALLFSVAFKKVQVPWVVALIFSGIAVGPHGFALFEINQTIDFISQVGLVLLMFMAGLETKLSSLDKFKEKMYFLAAFNAIIPFLVGIFIANMFGLSYIATVLVGIIFMSSSIAVVIPTLEVTGLIKTKLGSSVLATSIVQDIASLIFLSVFLQTEENIANLPLYLFYPMVVLILMAARKFLPELQKILFKGAIKEDDLFQRDLRVVLFLLFGVVILFELLGLHPIIGGFFTGLVLSESLDSEVLMGKIRAISYGIFIPTFFVVVGMETDVQRLLNFNQAFYLTIAISVGSILSKLLSGTIGAKLVGFNFKQSLFFGATSVPQLSTTLAATFTAMEFGLLDDSVVVAMVTLSIVSTVLGPMIMSSLEKYVLTQKDIHKSAN